MSSPFQQPSQAGDKVPMAELTGALVLIRVTGHRTGIATSFGEKDAIECDVHVLDGKHGGEVFDNALLFQGALIGALKPAAGGDPVLARVGVGTAKAGQNAPYILLPFTDADAAVAGPYWASVQAKGFQAPATVPAAPAPAAPAAAPATANGQVNLDSLPPEVQALIRQSLPA